MEEYQDEIEEQKFNSILNSDDNQEIEVGQNNQDKNINFNVPGQILSSGGTTTKNALSYVNGLIPSAQESSIVVSNGMAVANDSVAIPSTELNAQSYVDNLLNKTDQIIKDDIDGLQSSIQQYDLDQFTSPTNTNGLLMRNFTGSSNSHQLLDEAAEIIDDDEESMYQEDDFEEDVTPGQQTEKPQQIVANPKMSRIAPNQIKQEPKTLIRANQMPNLEDNYDEEEFLGNYEDLGIKEDNEDYIYDDLFEQEENEGSDDQEQNDDQQNMDMESENKGEIVGRKSKSAKQDQESKRYAIDKMKDNNRFQGTDTPNKGGSMKRKTYNIDDEGSIPDIRSSRHQRLQTQHSRETNKMSSTCKSRPDDKLRGQQKIFNKSVNSSIQRIANSNEGNRLNDMENVIQEEDLKIINSNSNTNESKRDQVVTTFSLNQNQKQDSNTQAVQVIDATFAATQPSQDAAPQQFSKEVKKKQIAANQPAYASSAQIEYFSKSPKFVKQNHAGSRIPLQQQKFSPQKKQSPKKNPNILRVMNSKLLPARNTSEQKKKRVQTAQAANARRDVAINGGNLQQMVNSSSPGGTGSSQSLMSGYYRSRKQFRQQQRINTSNSNNPRYQNPKIRQQDPTNFYPQGDQQEQDMMINKQEFPNQVDSQALLTHLKQQSIANSSHTVGDVSANGSNIINVHQHFNQPNIMNFNHNEYSENNLAPVDMDSGGQDMEENIRDLHELEQMPRKQKKRGVSAAAGRNSRTQLVPSELTSHRYAQVMNDGRPVYRGGVNSTLNKKGSRQNILMLNPYVKGSRSNSRSQTGLSNNLGSGLLHGTFQGSRTSLNLSRRQMGQRNLRSAHATRTNLAARQARNQQWPQQTTNLPPEPMHFSRLTRNMSANRTQTQGQPGLNDTANMKISQNYIIASSAALSGNMNSNNFDQEEVSTLFSGQTLGQSMNMNQQAILSQPLSSQAQQNLNVLRQYQNTKLSNMNKMSAGSRTTNLSRLQSASVNKMKVANNQQMPQSSLIYNTHSQLSHNPLQQSLKKKKGPSASVSGFISTNPPESPQQVIQDQIGMQYKSPSSVIQQCTSSAKQIINANAIIQNRKVTKPSDYIKKEDMYDKLLVLKSELNALNEENTKLKTKNAIQSDHLKQRDKFIDELLKSTYVMSQAMNAGGFGEFRKTLEQLKAARKLTKGESKTESQKLQNDLNMQAQDYFQQNFLEKGPYNMLKLKKQLNEMKELLQQKMSEVADLTKNMKSTKVMELQVESQVYQNECLKLRNVAEKAVDILIKNNLEDQLRSSKKLRYFAKNIDWSKFEQENDTQSSQKQGAMAQSAANEEQNQNMIKQLMNHGDNLQNQLTELANKHQEAMKDREMLIQKLQEFQIQYRQKEEQLQKTTDVIQNMEAQVAQLKTEKHDKVYELANQVQKIQDNQVKQLTVDQSQQTTQGVDKKIESLELKLKESEAALENSRSQVAAMKASSLGEANPAQEQLHSVQTNLATNNQNSDEILQKTLKKLSEETQKKQQLKDKIKEHEVSFNALNTYIKTADQKNLNYSSQVKDLNTQLATLKKEHAELSEKNQQELRKSNQEYIDLQKFVKELQTEIAQKNQENIELTKKLQSSNLFSSSKDSASKVNDQLQVSVQRLSELLAESQVTNSELMAERLHIQEQLQKVNYEDIDTRSDIISQIKSQIAYPRSPVRYFKKGTDVTSKSRFEQKQKEIIEENVEDDEEYQHADNQSMKKLQQEIVQQDRQDIKTKGKPKLLAQIGKSNSSVDQSSFAFLNKNMKQKTQLKLFEQIENIPDDNDSIYTEDLSQFMVTQNQSQMKQQLAESQKQNHQVTRVKMIQDDNPMIISIKEKVALFQQIKRINNDNMERELFGKKFAINKQIKIIDMAGIFRQKFDLTSQQATEFARYLVEEKEDEDQEDDTVYYDPNQKIKLQMLAVKFMSKILCPLVYRDQDEEDAREKFTKAFPKRQAQFIRIVNEFAKTGQRVNLKEFKELINKHSNNNHNLTDMEIECGYVILCRGVNFEEIGNLKDLQISKALSGFDSKKTFLLFNDIQDEETTTTNSLNESKKRFENLLKKGDENNRKESNTRLNLKETNINQDRRSSRGSIGCDVVTPVLGGFTNIKLPAQPEILIGCQSSEDKVQAPEITVDLGALKPPGTDVTFAKKANYENMRRASVQSANIADKIKEMNQMAELEKSSKASSKDKKERKNETKKRKLMQMPSFNPDVPNINIEFSQTKKENNDDDIFLKNPQFSLLSPMEDYVGVERSNSKFDKDDELLQSTPRINSSEKQQEKDSIYDKYSDSRDEDDWDLQASERNARVVQELKDQHFAKLQEEDQQQQTPYGEILNHEGVEKFDKNDLEIIRKQAEIKSQNSDRLAFVNSEQMTSDKQPLQDDGQIPSPSSIFKQKEAEKSEQQNKSISMKSASKSENSLPETEDKKLVSKHDLKIKQQEEARKKNETAATNQELNIKQNITKNQPETLVSFQQESPSTQDDQEKKADPAVEALQAESDDEDIQIQDQEQQVSEEAPVEEEVKQIVQEQDEQQIDQVQIQVGKPKAVVPNLPEAQNPQASMGTILSEQLKVLSPKSPEEQTTNAYQQIQEVQIIDQREEQQQQIVPDEALQNLLITCLNNKFEDNIRDSFNQQSVEKVIFYASEIFLVLTHNLQPGTTVRDLLHKDIYTIKEYQEDESAREIEVLKSNDLIERINEVLAPHLDLDYAQKNCIQLIFQNPKYGELIIYQELCQVFELLGVPEGKPVGQSGLNYLTLDLKSIRIINRLQIYLTENQLDFKVFLSDIVKMMQVRTKTKTPAVELFESKAFFSKLCEIGITKSDLPHENLCQLICIDKKYSHLLMFKKMKRCLHDFKSNQNRYFTQVGNIKNKIDIDEVQRDMLAQNDGQDAQHNQEMMVNQMQNEPVD